jgi:hypothetical protein
MTAMTIKKGIAGFCFLFSVVLFLPGAYYLRSAPIEYGWEAAMGIAIAFLLYAIAAILHVHSV